MFVRNVETFKDNISMVSMQMTKQNIEDVIEGDVYFDYLYDNFLIDWDSFARQKKLLIHINLLK